MQIACLPSSPPHDVGNSGQEVLALYSLTRVAADLGPGIATLFICVLSTLKCFCLRQHPKEMQVSFLSPLQRFGECCEKLRVVSHAGAPIEVIRDLALCFVSLLRSQP